MEGKIVKIISKDYTVLSNNSNYVCKSRGKFRNMHITPLVGDNVIFDEKTKYIMEVKDRTNELVRPYVSNISQVFIVASTKHPELDLNLLDKLLVMIEFNNIRPIICFTKLDLLDSDELDKIKTLFKNNITVFTGQSGAGKSTLLNKLDVKLNLETNDISEALGRGKHTTRHTELISMFDGLVADTPGFSSLDLTSMTKEDIRDNFIEFNKYRSKCLYRDCMHDKELLSECEIKRQLGINILQSRYDNYLKFIEKR